MRGYRRPMAPQLRRRMSQHLAGLGALVNVDTEQPFVAITFADGPDPGSTSAFLEVLRRTNARATFFVLAERALRHPELTAQIRADGHELAVHGWDHRNLATTGPRLPRAAFNYRRDLALRARDAIDPRARWYRPTFDQHNPAVARAIRAAGMTPVSWSVSAQDWKPQPATRIANSVLASVTSGDIVLWHDAIAETRTPAAFDRSQSLAALDCVLASLSSSMRFVTLSDLVDSGNPVWRVGSATTRSSGDAPLIQAPIAEPESYRGLPL